MSNIEKFISRYEDAKKNRSKEIRLQLNEAEQLVTELSCLSIRHMALSEKVIELQEKIITILRQVKEDNAVSVSMDGGDFK